LYVPPGKFSAPALALNCPLAGKKDTGGRYAVFNAEEICAKDVSTLGSIYRLKTVTGYVLVNTSQLYYRHCYNNEQLKPYMAALSHRVKRYAQKGTPFGYLYRILLIKTLGLRYPAVLFLQAYTIVIHASTAAIYRYDLFFMLY